MKSGVVCHGLQQGRVIAATLSTDVLLQLLQHVAAPIIGLGFKQLVDMLPVVATVYDFHVLFPFKIA